MTSLSIKNYIYLVDEYTEGVTKSSGVTTIEVTSSTPTTLYYYCDVHSGMGADITIN